MPGSGIIICLTMNDQGRLREVSARGHALKQGTASLACGLVSQALRSFGRCLADRPEIQFRGKPLANGEFDLRIVTVPSQWTAWFQGLQDFLEKTLLDASRDFPNDIEIKYQTIEQEI